MYLKFQKAFLNAQLTYYKQIGDRVAYKETQVILAKKYS